MGPRLTRIRLGVEDLLAACGGPIWRARPGLRVLTFHDVGGHADDPYSITVAAFRRFVALLASMRYRTVRAKDIADGYPQILDEDRAVALTFDDGMASHHDVVCPVLMQHGMTATFFAISSFLAGDGRTQATFGGHPRVFLGGRDLREMASAGFEIGSHTHTHRKLGELESGEALAELRESRQHLERALGQEVASVAYPYGRRGAFNDRTADLAIQAGYTVGFTQMGGGQHGSAHRMLLGRENIGRSDGVGSVRTKLAGYYDFLHRVLH